MIKKIINSPIFYYTPKYFTGDNVAHYLPAKYLWHACNVHKTGFYQPVYDFILNDPVSLDFMFYPDQPQHLYFKKPQWINDFIMSENEKTAKQIAKKYDFFINNYRYRGANPPETNWGYSPDLLELNLYLVAYTYKAIYEHNLYIDDLELADKYNDFLNTVNLRMNADKKPVITLHHRGNDPWSRHLPESIKLYENLLFNLLERYPEHIIVLVGESWNYYHHPRVKYLDDYINPQKLIKCLNEYSACLQFILQAYFCGQSDIAFLGISGFTLFIESIRSLKLMPPIPLFWGPKTFTGIDTCINVALNNWISPEFEKYKNTHPEDAAFQHYIHHFIYYSRDEELLKPYCLDYPNNLEKIFSILTKLEDKYRRLLPAYEHDSPYRIIHNIAETSDKPNLGYSLKQHQQFYVSFVNFIWKLQRLKLKVIDIMKGKVRGFLKKAFNIKIRL